MNEKLILDAKLVKISERNDVRCADVEVHMKGTDDVLLVEFTQSADNDYDISHVYRKEVSHEIDGYDNNLHKAYKDVTVEMFENEVLATNWKMREEFKQRVLAFGSVREDLKEHFQLFKKAALFRVEDQENQKYLH
jgi:hypothetical protein